MASPKKSIVIVTPALADDNNGNSRTAERWAAMLGPHHHVIVTKVWSGGDQDLMLALHARRSAASIKAWRQAWPSKPLVLAMTGTDLYRDIHSDPHARASLDLADALIVLNELGARSLPPQLRSRAQVVLQSCTERAVLPKPKRHLRALMVGHLRDEKSPQTYFEVARILARQAAQQVPVLLDHIGAPLDDQLGLEATQLTQSGGSYRWLGAVSHAITRRRIQAAHVLVHPSKMEGGAHVVMEAVRCGTPVLASRIDGNVGLLGANYLGYFEPGDAQGLYQCLLHCAKDPTILATLQAQVLARSPLFSPQAERAALRQVIEPLLGARPIEAS